jgi:hypothetical protein
MSPLVTVSCYLRAAKKSNFSLQSQTERVSFWIVSFSPGSTVGFGISAKT